MTKVLVLLHLLQDRSRSGQGRRDEMLVRKVTRGAKLSTKKRRKKERFKHGQPQQNQTEWTKGKAHYISFNLHSKGKTQEVLNCGSSRKGLLFLPCLSIGLSRLVPLTFLSCFASFSKCTTGSFTSSLIRWFRRMNSTARPRPVHTHSRDKSKSSCRGVTFVFSLLSFSRRYTRTVKMSTPRNQLLECVFYLLVRPTCQDAILEVTGRKP